MDSTNALHNALEKRITQILHLLDFAYFKHLLQFCEEKSLFNTVSEWPEFEQTFKERNGQSAVFCQEQHRATKQLFVELRARLHLMKGNDDIFEENDMLITERDRKAWNDRS